MREIGSILVSEKESIKGRVDMVHAANMVKKNPLALVVDDEPFIQLAFTTLLAKLGCEVDKASNGQIGVDIVLEHEKNVPYDIIFMDANMPVLNGYEAAKLIRLNSRVETPIICVSAQDSLKHQALCKECGMTEISKNALVMCS